MPRKIPVPTLFHKSTRMQTMAGNVIDHELFLYSFKQRPSLLLEKIYHKDKINKYIYWFSQSKAITKSYV